MTRHVRICNPGSGPRAIARKIAQRWVRRGVARWRGADIERIDAAGHLAVIITAARLAEIGCDLAARTGFASIKALRGLPMVGDVEVALVQRTGARQHFRGRSGPVRHQTVST